MADIADIAADDLATVIEAAVSEARAPLAAGVAGECAQCEWWMPRLVDGLCGFCRDGRPRPPDWEPPTPPRQTEALPPSREEITMGAKTIQLPAFSTAAIAAVEQEAASGNMTLGLAAATLIERGIAAALASSIEPAPADLREIGTTSCCARSPTAFRALPALPSCSSSPSVPKLPNARSPVCGSCSANLRGQVRISAPGAPPGE